MSQAQPASHCPIVVTVTKLGTSVEAVMPVLLLLLLLLLLLSPVPFVIKPYGGGGIMVVYIVY